MDPINTFTSTGQKILRHGNLLAQWNRGHIRPQSLQVALTEKCTLKCAFCSVANRESILEIPFDDLVKATEVFRALGIQTVEITGGGDPLLYPMLNDYLEYLFRRIDLFPDLLSPLEVGLITNGIGINKLIKPELRNQLTWIRISANVLDYRPEIELPEGYPGVLGFSYCWNEGLSTEPRLQAIREIALAHKVRYIRMVPNCIATSEELQRQHDFLKPLVERLGSPFFYQQKNFQTPQCCYWAYWKPFLYCDGYVFPCSSTVLNDDAGKRFNENYRWFHWSEARRIYAQPIQSAIDTTRCTHCVFSEQNKLLEYALQRQEMEEFV
jgi:hypothetical protein